MNNKNSDRLKRIRKFIIKTICLPIIPFEFGKKIRQLLIRGIFLDGVKTFVSLLHNKPNITLLSPPVARTKETSFRNGLNTISCKV